MTRREFRDAYRAARVVLRVMTRGADHRGRQPTPGEQKAAEEQWIAGINGKTRDAFLAVAASLKDVAKPLSVPALYAYRHGLYHTDRTAWRGWVREKLATRRAA